MYEVWATNTTAFLPEQHKRDWGIRGESVAVSLPSGAVLFTTLATATDHKDLAEMSMKSLDPSYRNDVVESAARIASNAGVYPVAAVAQSHYPTLLTFRDINIPASVVKVEAPEARALGPGYRIRRVIVQITGDEVTTGIEKRLPWLRSYRNKTFAGNRYAIGPSLADSLTAGRFSTELRD